MYIYLYKNIKIMISYTRKLDTYLQEEDDFMRAKAILQDLFGKTLKRIEKQPNHTPIDLRFTASTLTQECHYAVELKRNSFKYIETNPNLPLLVNKYISMKGNVRDDEKLMMMFMSDSMYVIYDIGEIARKPLCELDMRIWTIPLENYSTRDIGKIPQPTIWLPLSDMKVSGMTTVQKDPSRGQETAL